MILLTGVTGFIGRKLLSRLPAQDVVAACRNPERFCAYKKSLYFNLDTDSYGDFDFNGIKTIIHLAAIAHSSAGSEMEFNQRNHLSVLRFAQAAADAGVRRFIFLSSIGVSGGSSSKPFAHDDTPNPHDIYSSSKYNAELALKKISIKTGLEVVIIRPPLVYGKGAPGSFGNLLKLAKKNLPLPLGAIHNKRSFISIDNLVDFIVTCIEHPLAEGKTFLVSDDNDVSTTVFIKSLIKASGKTPYLIPVNVSLLRFIAGLVGKSSTIDKVACDLQIDMSYAKDTLGWKPPISLQEGIRRCFTDE